MPRLGLDIGPTESPAQEPLAASPSARVEPEAPPDTVPPAPTSAPELDTSKTAAALRKRVNRLLRRSPLRGVQLGLVVADVATGKELVRVAPDRPLNPASTLKLFTSAAALSILGPDHRFETRVQVAERAGRRTVYLAGTGDPMLWMEHLKSLADRAAPQLKRLGRMHTVAVDASAFGGGVLPPGFGAKNTDAAYRAATGAVALEWGTAVVEVHPTREGRKPRVVVSPPGGYVIEDNRARTVSGRGSTIKIKLKSRGKRSVAVITGRIGRARRRPTWVRRRVEHPPLAAAYAFRRLLKQRGVEVGEVAMETTPRGATLVAKHRSERLATIAAKMNKYSNNFIAEMLLRAVARRPPTHRQGTWKRGKAAVQRWLEKKVGLSRGSFRYLNGSGLYSGGLFSARAVTRLLLHMDKKSRHRRAFRDSLAASGGEGTLKTRLRKRYAGKVIGKTGTLNQVSALSGYARNRAGRLLAFSIIMNRTNKATARMRSIQDRICALLLSSR